MSGTTGKTAEKKQKKNTGGAAGASSRISRRTWFNVVLFGLMGQIAWNVENMYFNTFLFNRIGGTTRDINVMVAASAATAVITTFLMGALSDRIGKRKPLISVGYILWGVSVMTFAFISRENTARILPGADAARVLAVTVSMVVVMDCVMTFMGSTCNDAAFNAWLTDVTDKTNRGRVESVNTILPLAAMLLVTVGFGMGATALGYPACFIGLGLLVIFCGVLGLFTIKDAPHVRKNSENFFKELTYGFRPAVIRANASLYILLAAQCIGAIAMQVIVPYIFIYLQHYMGFDFNNLNLSPAIIVVAVVAVGAAVAAVLIFGRVVDRFGKDRFVIPAAILQTAGLALAYPMRSLLGFIPAAAIFGVGQVMIGIMLGAAVRDHTPRDKVGSFQGVRMIFNVLLPMVIGPKIGSLVIERFAQNHAAGTYINDYGESVAAPVPEIFLAAAIVAVFTLIPLIVMRRRGFEAPEEAEEDG